MNRKRGEEPRRGRRRRCPRGWVPEFSLPKSKVHGLGGREREIRENSVMWTILTSQTSVVSVRKFVGVRWTTSEFEGCDVCMFTDSYDPRTYCDRDR